MYNKILCHYCNHITFLNNIEPLEKEERIVRMPAKEKEEILLLLEKSRYSLRKIIKVYNVIESKKSLKNEISRFIFKINSKSKN